ncbi:MAG: hypothetical protein JWR80_2822 [Bradyrhizobium sp.]|nr:hypothetical protein [Bradyrhizobium sp.]
MSNVTRMTSNLGHILLSSAMLSIVGTTAAEAQTSEATAVPASVSTDDGGVAEITVTARRRKESLQSTPVSATVLSSTQLVEQNIRNFASMRGAVSNLEIEPTFSGGTSFTIRGLGQTSDQANADSKAGFYVNEMYVSRMEGNDLYFYDVASLQVLKGPQGTLFGKNTTAGAVLLTTAVPEDKAGGYLQLRGGSFRRIETEGAVNMPLADNLFGRVSFRTQDAKGFINHVLDNDTSGNINSKSVRGQLRFESDRLTADVLAEYNHSATDGGAYITVGCLQDAPYVINYNALHTVPYCAAYPVLGKPYLVYGGATLSIPTSSAVTDVAAGGDANSASRRFVGKSPYNNNDIYTGNVRLTYKLSDDVALRSITTYRRSRSGWYTPTQDAPDDIYAENDTSLTNQFTQELTLGGKAMDGRLDFLTGVFYFKQNTQQRQDTGPDWIDPLGYRYDAGFKYQSYAGFVQASFKITPKLELTAGLRYTYDTKDASSDVFFAGNNGTYTVNGGTRACGWFVNDFIGGIANCAGAPFVATGRDHWDGFDPKVQLSYRWSEQLYTYITAAHGYNSGGFNQQIGSPQPDGRFASTYNPEKLWSYEAGFKTDLFDRRLQFNVSGFYQKYSDIQATVIVVLNGISTRQFQTAASAREAGFEAEFVARPVPDLSIRGNASYLSQKYEKITPGALIGRDTPVNSAPKYQFSAAVSYDIHFGGHRLTPAVDVRGVGKKPSCYTPGTPTDPQAASCNLPAYALVGARLDYVPYEGSPLRLSFYGTNVFDKVTQLHRESYSGGQGTDRYTPGRPAEFGAELAYKF